MFGKDINHFLKHIRCFLWPISAAIPKPENISVIINHRAWVKTWTLSQCGADWQEKLVCGTFFVSRNSRVDVEKVRSRWSQKGILRIKIPESTTTTQTARDSWTYWPIFCSFLASSPSRRTNTILCWMNEFLHNFLFSRTL